MNKEINFGDKVRDKISGFAGIVTSKTEFINGCVQYGITPRMKKGDKLYPESIAVDEVSIEVIKTKHKKIKRRETGGPSRPAFSMRGY